MSRKPKSLFCRPKNKYDYYRHATMAASFLSMCGIVSIMVAINPSIWMPLLGIMFMSVPIPTLALIFYIDRKEWDADEIDTKKETRHG